MAIVLAAWQLGLASPKRGVRWGIANTVVEQELATRAQLPTQWPACPNCGTCLHSKGLRSRQVQTKVGIVHCQRRVGRCPQGCQGSQVAPFDEALGVNAYRTAKS